MKTAHKTKVPPVRSHAKVMTLGDLISATYKICGPKQAPKILKLALGTHLVRFKGIPYLG